jgi:hypothetical protein
MAIDPNILLQRTTPDIGQALLSGLQSAAGIRQLQQSAAEQPYREQLLKAQAEAAPIAVEAQRLQNLTSQQKLTVQGAALAAQQAVPYLQSGDMAGLRNFLSGTNLLDEQDKAELLGKVDANDLQGILADVSGAIGMAQQMGIFETPRAEADGRTAAMKEAEAVGFTPGTPEYRDFILSKSAKTPSVSIRQGTDPVTGQPGFYQFSNGQLVGKVEGINPPAQTGVVVGPDGTVTIGAPLASGNVAKAQEKVTTAMDNLARLREIRTTFDPQFLTYLGQGRQALLRTKERAGVTLDPAEQQSVGQYRQFSEGVDQFFNQYRKDITGAAAAVSELSSLKDAILNKDLSPTEFVASFDRLVNESTRTINIQNALLEQGLTPSSKAFQQQADQLFMSGQGKNYKQRGTELEKQGLSDDQIRQQLRLEGYSIR